MDSLEWAWRKFTSLLKSQAILLSLSATLQAPKVLKPRLTGRKTWKSKLTEMVPTSHDPSPPFQESQVEVEAPSVGRNEISTQTTEEW